MVQKMRNLFVVRWLLPFALLFCFAGTLQAQGSGPGFHASAGGDQNCPFSGGTVSSLTPPVSVGPVSSNCSPSGSGIAAARADAGTLGALAGATHTCCGTAAGAGGQARFQVPAFTITGPAAGSIPVSINLHIQGLLESNPDFGGASLTLFVTFGGFSKSEIVMTSSGVLNKDGVFAPVNVTFPSATLNHDLVTPTLNVTPNQPLYIEIMLIANASMAGQGSTQTDFFSGSNGLAFPIGVPVFNLPAGYTVDIPELKVFNNLWQGGVAPANISVSPLSVNFGSVTLGSQSTAVVTATNTGGTGLTVNSPSLGAGSSAFSILSVKKNGSVVTPPVTLANNETLDVEVAFSPTAIGPASRTLNISSNDPDQNSIGVALSGDGVQAQTPPSQQIEGILEFFDASVAAGTLQGDGPGVSAQARLKALANMIEAAGDFINAGDFSQACTQLSDVLSRIDGNPRPPDFATGSALPQLQTMITDLKTSLGCH